jgi:predicted amidohydrolase
MKASVRAAAVQLAPQPLDRAGNTEAMAAHIRRESDADLLVFPELATTGYVPAAYDADFHRGLVRESDTVPGPTTDALGAAARRARAHVVFGMSERRDDRLVNSAVLLGPDGDVLGVQPKVHVWREEQRYFAAGDRFLVFATSLGVIGLSICYDSRFPESTRVQALAGAEILVCLFALADGPEVAEATLRHRAALRALENNAYYVACNRLGGEFFGSSVICSPSGAVLTGDEPTAPVVRARLDGAELSSIRRHADIFADRRPDAYAIPAVQGRQRPHS